MKPFECRARVDAVRRLAPEILEADLRLDEPPALEFVAGQWVSVPFGPKTVRAYSIASTPRSPTRLTWDGVYRDATVGRALADGRVVPRRASAPSAPERAARRQQRARVASREERERRAASKRAPRR